MGGVLAIRSKLSTGRPGKVRLFSQRDLEPRPWLNCRFYAWVTQAWWAGLRWEGGAQTALAITELLRRESGRPEVGAGGALQGSAAADLDRALARVFPWMRVEHRRISDRELLDSLGKRYIVGVPVWLPKLPARQQRWSGGGAIGHQVSLVDARKATREVRYLDPLGSPPYGGDWAKLKALQPALDHYGDPTFCTVMEKGDAMLTLVTPQRAFAPGTATARLGKRTYQVFVVRDGDFRQVRDVRVTEPENVEVGYVARVERQPRGIHGRFTYLMSGPLKERFVRASDVTVTVAEAPPDMAAAIARAKAEGRAEAESEFTPITQELYERETP